MAQISKGTQGIQRNLSRLRSPGALPARLWGRQSLGFSPRDCLSYVSTARGILFRLFTPFCSLFKKNFFYSFLKNWPRVDLQCCVNFWKQSDLEYMCVCIFRSFFILGYCCCYCSVAKSCLTLHNPVDCSTPGFPVLHHLPEFAQVIGYYKRLNRVPCAIYNRS